jgi:hypothetical protein
MFIPGSGGFVHSVRSGIPGRLRGQGLAGSVSSTQSRCEKATRSAQIHSHRTMDRSDIPRLVCRPTFGSGADGQRRSVHRAAYSAARRAGDHPSPPQDFPIEEIVDRARQEGLHKPLRPGVYVHVVQRCVANRPPNPSRYRMLYGLRHDLFPRRVMPIFSPSRARSTSSESFWLASNSPTARMECSFNLDEQPRWIV